MEPIRSGGSHQPRGRRVSRLEAPAARRVLEREARKYLGSVLQRLDIPSRRDLDSLSQRIDHLERQLHAHERAVRVAPRAAVAPSVEPSVSAAGRHATCAVCHAVLDANASFPHVCSPRTTLSSIQYAELFWDEV